MIGVLGFVLWLVLSYLYYYYLVMYLNHSEQGTVKLYMIKYLYSVVQELPYYLVTTAVTLADDHLLKVQNEGKTQYLP